MTELLRHCSAYESTLHSQMVLMSVISKFMVDVDGSATAAACSHKLSHQREMACHTLSLESRAVLQSLFKEGFQVPKAETKNK